MDMHGASQAPGIYKPCAYNPEGATADFCRRTSGTLEKAHGKCLSSNCRSPERLCVACVEQGEQEPAKVLRGHDRLCSFHAMHGQRARRSAYSQPFVQPLRQPSRNPQIVMAQPRPADQARPPQPSVTPKAAPLGPLARVVELPVRKSPALVRPVVVGVQPKASEPVEVVEEKVDIPPPIPVQEDAHIVTLREQLTEIAKKTRRTSAEKMVGLEVASFDLRKQGTTFRACDLIGASAKLLGMAYGGLSSFYAMKVPEETKTRLLYGEGGRKIPRSEIKFGILMEVREQMRKDGKPAPTKMDLAKATQKPLGMQFRAACAYVYERLSLEQVKVLEFAAPPIGRKKQIAILKRLRQEMRDKGLPAPRQMDLAEVAAPLLNQKPHSVRAMINKFSPAVKKALEFSGDPAVMIAEMDPTVLYAGFVGAVAVLKLRKLPVTATKLRPLLGLKQAVVDEYLQEHPDVRALLDD